MGESEAFRQVIEQLPIQLRDLLQAELAAGNRILDAGHSFPAPPAGAFVLLEKRVTTHPRQSSGELRFFERNGSLYSGEFCDERRFFFVLEAPLPATPPPDMDAIRESANGVASLSDPGELVPDSGLRWMPPGAPQATSKTDLVRRFEASMVIDYEKWHDGIGYEVEWIVRASAEERRQIEAVLLTRGVKDWRDVEALAALDTEAARFLLRATLNHPDAELKTAVLRYAPDLAEADTRERALVEAIATATVYGGLTSTLRQVQDFHPPAVMEALLRAALQREGVVAVHCAAMLLYLHGKASDPFDWEQRPFFLRFSSPDNSERESAFRELCARIGVDLERFLP